MRPLLFSVAIVAGIVWASLPAAAHHIDEETDGTATLVTCTVNWATTSSCLPLGPRQPEVTNWMWWMGGTVVVDPGPFMVDLLNDVWETVCGIIGNLSPALAEFLGCGSDLSQRLTVVQGVSACEANGSGVDGTGQAGLGGRCYSSLAGPPPVPSVTAWGAMTVYSIGAGCRGTDPGFHAYLGNQVHSANVAPGEVFYYRSLAVEFLANGHIGYTIDAGSFPSHVMMLGCFGGDTHTLGTAPSSSDLEWGCNETDDEEPSSVDGDPVNYSASPVDSSTVCA